MTEPKTTTTRAKAAVDATPKSIGAIISRISEEAGALHKSRAAGGGVPFEFRGIDAVINHLAPHMDKYGIFSTSRITHKETTPRPLVDRDGNPNGKAITQTDITVEYTFHAPDGSSVTTEVPGLAQDHADRSAAQAMSVAYRVALLQLFHLPTDSPEPEVNGEDTQRYIEKNTQAAASAPAKPAGRSIDDVKADIGAIIGDPTNSVDGDQVNKLVATIAKTSDAGKWTAAHLEQALADLRKQVASGE